MSAIELFNYSDGEVRIVVIDGDPWFVLADLCRVLGLNRSASAVAERLDDGVRQTYPITDTLGRSQQATIVSEAGMYEVVIRSDKPEAVAFRRWITHEVLPTIRKTRGAYIAPRSQAELDLTNVDEVLEKLIEVATIAKRERAKRLEAEAWARELEPAAAVTVFLADAEGDDFAFADAAKILSRHPLVKTGQRRLFDQLHEWKWIYRAGGRRHWCAYQSEVDAGRLVERIGQPYEHRTRGWVMPNPQVRITVKGMQDILHKLTGERDLAVGMVSA